MSGSLWSSPQGTRAAVTSEASQRWMVRGRSPTSRGVSGEASAGARGRGELVLAGLGRPPLLTVPLWPAADREIHPSAGPLARGLWAAQPAARGCTCACRDLGSGPGLLPAMALRQDVPGLREKPGQRGMVSPGHPFPSLPPVYPAVLATRAWGHQPSFLPLGSPDQ